MVLWFWVFGFLLGFLGSWVWGLGVWVQVSGFRFGVKGERVLV